MASYIRHTLVFISLAELFPVPSDRSTIFRVVPAGCVIGPPSMPNWRLVVASGRGPDESVQMM